MNNNNLEQMVQDNEKILWQEKPNKACYTWSSILPFLPFAIIWLIFDGGILTTAFKMGAPREMWMFLIPFFAVHLIPVWAVFGMYVKTKLEYPNVIYAITDKRILLRDGFIGIDIKSIDYSEIDNVSVSVNILEKFNNVGTIIFSVDGAPYRIISINDPYGVHKMLQKLSFDVKTDINYPNKLRPEDNPGYTTKYDIKK